ncbi:DUF805 domain-containing protein [Tamlana agarivorans]|uniref:DUF805 domain-containing protein n=1 Tax=Pseudotamlana agarivorans TaxID=481183 RepID=A0ACC5U6Q0_9FLAO|nr:DUF805 domain-containing protein [Tamlana agarivorans]MBU2949924.1 DUF805 domain-containing protein [Tamlana agarivorans]
MNWYLKVLKQYADFKGRARRKEFWMFLLFSFLVSAVASILDNVLGLTFKDYGGNGPILGLYSLFVLIPGLAVTVRRLHDIGKSGWWLFIGLIPLIGAIWLLILYCKDSEAGSNKWGPNPKSSADGINQIGVE